MIVALAYRRDRRDVSGSEAIGVDEVIYAKDHWCATMVYELNGQSCRILHVGEGQIVNRLLPLFRMLRWAKIHACELIGYICSEMWRAYLKVLTKKLRQALEIHDHYHLVANLNKALDEMGVDKIIVRKAKG